MKVSAIGCKQQAFKGFERVAVKTSDIKNGSVDTIMGLYGKICYGGRAVGIANMFQDSLQDDILRESKASNLSAQWYIENLKHHGAKVPENFMSGTEDVVIATGLEDMKKLSRFLTKSVAQRKAEGAAAAVKSVFLPQYRKVPKTNRYYYAMCDVLDKYNTRLSTFLTENQAKNVTLEQILRKIRRVEIGRLLRKI